MTQTLPVVAGRAAEDRADGNKQKKRSLSFLTFNQHSFIK